MTTTWTPAGKPSQGGTRIAEDVLADQGGIVRQRGTISHVLDKSNGFDLMRQHQGSGTPRPAPSLGSYPSALWLTGIGTENDGYGSLDSGGGTYINLDRSREGVNYTQSWWWAPMGGPGALGTVTFYVDTEAWRNSDRSYHAVELNLGTREMRIRPNNGGVQQLVATDIPVPEWNDNKFDNTYCSMTTYLGSSQATGTNFGAYVCFQIGSTVYDLRGLGGSAKYPTSGTAQPGSGFAGGRNPGLGFTTPLPGVAGGVAVFRFLETIGDTVV